jgi:hypothetical protein
MHPPVRHAAGRRGIFAVSLAVIKTPPPPLRTTMLALVQTLTNGGCSEREVEDQVLELVGQGRVVLIGNFRAASLGRSHSIDPTETLTSNVNQKEENCHERS